MQNRAALYLILAATAFSPDASAHQPVLNSIERYCAKTWQRAHVSPQDRYDCTQAVFAELLHRLEQEQWGTALSEETSDERRELNRAVWCVLQRWRRTRSYSDLPEESILPSNQEQVCETLEEQRELLRQFLPELSERQQIILNETIQGATTQQIAQTLQTTASIVSDEKYKAIRKLKNKVASLGQV